MIKTNSIGILLALLLIFPASSKAQIVIGQPRGITSGGSGSITSLSCIGNGTAAAPCYTGLDTDNGMFFTSTSVRFSTNGAESFVINEDNNLGVSFLGGAGSLNSNFFTLPAASIWYWNARSVMRSTADGSWDLTNNAQNVVSLGVTPTAITIPIASKYGFVGVSNALTLNGASTSIRSADGGAYFNIANGLVQVNSATLQLASGGVGLFNFTASVDGKITSAMASGNTGVGWDVTTNNIFAIRTIAQTGDAAIRASIHASSTSSVLTVTTNTIAPTGSIHHLGAGLIKTITVPATCTPTCSIAVVPDAAFTYDATGNITVPVGAGLALINKTMWFTWDGTKWNPSY